MNSKKTLILVAALVIGALSAGMIWQYVGGIEEKANGNAERVKVFVVKTEIIKGTYGEETKAQKTIAEDEIPKKFYPENAIRELTDIEGKQAINNLAPNQIVTTDMFADPATVQSSFADRLDKINDKQQVAITVSVDEVRAVAGLLQPGDFVNIMIDDICQRPGGSGLGGGGTSESEGEAPPVDPAASEDDLCPEDILFRLQDRHLFQKVQILAIGKTPVPQAGEVKAAAGEDEAAVDPAALGDVNLITFIVPAKSAQYIASLAESMYLALVGDDYVPENDLGVISEADRLPGEDPEKLTPYGPKGVGDK